MLPVHTCQNGEKIVWQNGKDPGRHSLTVENGLVFVKDYSWLEISMIYCKKGVAFQCYQCVLLSGESGEEEHCFYNFYL
jgi:hypothetical protein